MNIVRITEIKRGKDKEWTKIPTSYQRVEILEETPETITFKVAKFNSKHTYRKEHVKMVLQTDRVLEILNKE